MSRNPTCTVYIGNLDEKVNDRVLYEILIQVGRVVDLYIPRDKETNRHRGYGFAEYESEEIANYAVRLFSGLVRLHNKTLRFAISGQDKTNPNSATPVTPKPNSPPNPTPQNMHVKETEMSLGSAPPIASCRMSAHSQSNYPQASPLGYVSNGFIASNFEYTRRIFGSPMNTISPREARRDYPSC